MTNSALSRYERQRASRMAATSNDSSLPPGIKITLEQIQEYQGQSVHNLAKTATFNKGFNEDTVARLEDMRNGSKSHR